MADANLRGAVDTERMGDEYQIETIALIGARHRGQPLARIAPPARRIVIANSSGPESVSQLVSTLGEGASPGTIGDAADGSAST
jgi:predicted dinucleotide-binding enzyme